MRVVAGQAAFFVQQRPVYPVLAEDILDQTAVAPLAEFKTGPPGSKRIAGRRVFMTLVAHLAGNRLVDIIKENAGSVRAVRVMACCTTGPLHWVVHMSFRKHRLIGLMAAQAKRRHFVPQEEFCLYRGMGVVAGETSFF